MRPFEVFVWKNGARSIKWMCGCSACKSLHATFRGQDHIRTNEKEGKRPWQAAEHQKRSAFNVANYHFTTSPPKPKDKKVARKKQVSERARVGGQFRRESLR